MADISVFVGEAITVGETPGGLRRLIPILGGTIRGDRLRGIILPGGADYQTVRQDGYTHLDARYAAKTDDGDMVYIVNEGVRFGKPELIVRITRGETVAPFDIYFRTLLRFETAERRRGNALGRAASRLGAGPPASSGEHGNSLA